MNEKEEKQNFIMKKIVTFRHVKTLKNKAFERKNFGNFGREYFRFFG